MNYFIDPIKNYVNFSGRATRKEYWMFILIYIILSILLSILDGVLWTNGILSLVFALFMFLPSLAIAVRRLHDIGKSGWWILISLIPFIWPIWLLVLLVLKSDGDNKYGPNKYWNKQEEKVEK